MNKYTCLLFCLLFRMAYRKTGTRDPSGTLAGPYENRKTGTIAGPYKNRKTGTLADPT